MYLSEPELYHSVRGDILRGCLGHMSAADSATIGRFALERLLRPRRGLLRAQPTYKEALIAWTISTNQLTYDELETLRDSEVDWWVRKCMLRELTSGQYGMASFRDFLNRSIRIHESETARCAAARLVADSVPLDEPHTNIFEPAKLVLRASKIIKSVGTPPSMINSIIAYVLKRPETTYDWIKLFGPDHMHAEQMAIFLKQSRETDIDAFMTRFDSFADNLTAEIFRRKVVGKKYPNYGSALKHPILVSSLPNAMNAFSLLHDLRLESVTAHPRSLKTGVGTRRLKHRDFYKIRPVLQAAFDEIEQTII